MQNIIKHLNELLSQHAMTTRQSIYWRHSSFANDLGDESSISYASYIANMHENMTEEQTTEFYDKDQIITSGLIAMDITRDKQYRDYKRQSNPNCEGHFAHWVSPAFDYLHIQITDHSIHITDFRSGQY